MLRFNGHVFYCPLNGALNGLIGLKPILSFIQPVADDKMLNKNGPLSVKCERILIVDAAHFAVTLI